MLPQIWATRAAAQHVKAESLGKLPAVDLFYTLTPRCHKDVF